MEMVEKSGENIVVVVQHGEGRRGNKDYLKNYRRYLLVWISSSCQARRSICLQVSRLQLANCHAKLPASFKIASCQKPRLFINKYTTYGCKNSSFCVGLLQRLLAKMTIIDTQ